MASQLLIATFSSREEMLRAFDALTMKHTNHIKHAAASVVNTVKQAGQML
jgi:hypothetical protein